MDAPLLIRSSSEDSFVLIDPEFDDTYYPELRGIAVADYVPHEKDEISMKRGDSLVIQEQSLDQQHFIVLNSRTTSQGKVPALFVKLVTDETSMEDTGEIVHLLNSDLHQLNYESDDDPGSDLDRGGKRVILRKGKETGNSLNRRGGVRSRRLKKEDDEAGSDLDQGGIGPRVFPGKKSGKMGIMRRKGVSKSKGSPYRSSGSSHEEEFAAYCAAGNHLQRSMERRNDLSRVSTPPTDNPTSSSLASSAKSTTPPRANMAGPPSRMVARLDSFQPYPPLALTNEERVSAAAAAAVASLPELHPELKNIQRHRILSVSGADRDGRPVIVFSASRLPPSYQINHDRLLEYCLLTLDQYVEQDYTVLYFHHGFSSANKPSISWIKRIYSELDRKYKKNLKKLYIVHPTNFIRMMMILLKPLISYKFGRKIAYINRLEELRPVLFLEQVDIPEEVKEYDAKLTSQIRNVTHPDSRSMFHVSIPSSMNTTSSTPEPSTRQFGVHLSKLRDRSIGGGEGHFLPLVVKNCVEFLETEGLLIVGIFRRAPNNVKVRLVKKRLDQGEEVDLFECADPHMAAVLIKMFLREMPEPLLTFEAYNQVMKFGSHKDETSRMQISSGILHNLPKVNYDLLNYLMTFIQKVREQEEVNKMNALNLAIVFGPNLIWSTDEVASLVGLGEINAFVHFMIRNKDALFTR